MTRLVLMPATNLACLTHSFARPIQAAFASAATFAVGAALPILTVMLAPQTGLTLIVSGVSLACLAALGALAARAGGASAWIGATRVAFWGALAMAATAGVGALFGTTVSRESLSGGVAAECCRGGFFPSSTTHPRA